DVRELPQPAHVLVLDVAAVLAKNDGDPIRAAEMRLHGGPHRVRLLCAARLAHGRDVVDVDAELDHVFSPRSPMRWRSRTIARVASSCPLREWLMRRRMSCFAWAAVVSSSRRPRSRSMSVRPRNFIALAGVSASGGAGTGPRSTT